jgi:nucleoside-diphosphate-sugar epimerase
MQSAQRPGFTVLGPSGSIGSRIVATLQARGHAVDAPRRGDHSVFDRHLGHVIYCIGVTGDFRSRPFETVDAHVSALAAVLERASFDSLLYLSSTRVYSRSDDGHETALLHVDPSDPSDLYDLTKLCGESLCISSGRPNVRVVRLSNVVGRDPASDDLVHTLIRAALDGHVELLSDRTSVKDYVLLDDVVDLLPRVTLEGRDRLYNVASGVNVTLGEVVDRLVALTGCSVNVRAGAPRHRFPLIDTERIRSEFGFSPAPALAALAELVEDCRSSPGRDGADHLSRQHGSPASPSVA